MAGSSFGFDGTDGPFCACGTPYHKHDKERVYPDDGPTGSYHYEYICP